MFKTVFITGVLTATWMSAQLVVAAADRLIVGQAAGEITAAQAAPFIGEWTLALQGPDGPGTFDLSVKVEKDKLAGEISSDQLPKRRSSSPR